MRSLLWLAVIGLVLAGCSPQQAQEQQATPAQPATATCAADVTHVVLGIDPEELLTHELQNNVGRNIREDLRAAPIDSTRLEVVGDHLEVEVANAADVPAAEQRIKHLGDPPVGSSGQPNSYEVTGRANVIEVRLTAAARERLQSEALASSLEAVQRRIAAGEFKAAAAEVNNRICVDAPDAGPEELDQLVELLLSPGVLTFNMVDEGATNQLRLDPTSWSAGEERGGRLALPNDGELDGGLQVIETDAIITGADVSDATQVFDQRNQPSVSFQLHPAGAQRFGRATEANIGRPFAIVLDSRIVSAPTIQSPIVTGDGQITGAFTVEGAKRLAIILRSGAMPAKLMVIERVVAN
jgi:protein-export membrane protein SecD